MHVASLRQNASPPLWVLSPSPRRGALSAVFPAIALCVASTSAPADEGGVSFWQPGTYNSLSATPNQPGWSVSSNIYTGPTFGGNSVAVARLIRIGAQDPSGQAQVTANTKGYDNIVTITPSYLFADEILGAQVELGLSTVVGHSTSEVYGTLAATTGSRAAYSRFDFSDFVTGFGDPAPQVTLYWKNGDNYFMAYGTGGVPFGEYSKLSLTNLGVGHAAVDIGGGYTYYSYDKGLEFSAVSGFTYNLKNWSTNYQNGVDFHFDSGASKYLNDNLFIGPVGYFYREFGCDSGAGDKQGCFQSQVAGAGGQIGFTFPVDHVQGYVNLVSYKEFLAENRAPGWSVRLTVSLSPREPKDAKY